MSDEPTKPMSLTFYTVLSVALLVLKVTINNLLERAKLDISNAEDIVNSLSTSSVITYINSAAHTNIVPPPVTSVTKD
jgi:hypothetical protein